jgi:hypothetical protein
MIPLPAAVYLAAQVVARIQLTAAFHLTDLNRPGCLELVEAWIEPDGSPRGNCEWGYADVIPWPYQAISWAAGPIAEARVLEIDPRDALEASAAYDTLVRYAERGVADIEEAIREGSRIVRECWTDIDKLALYLQQHHRADFEQVSDLLNLPGRPSVHDENTRPDTDRRRQQVGPPAEAIERAFEAASRLN